MIIRCIRKDKAIRISQDLIEKSLPFIFRKDWKGYEFDYFEKFVGKVN